MQQAEVCDRPPDVAAYRHILEMTREGICLLDTESRITFVNGRLCEMLGCGQRDLLGRQSFEVFGQALSEDAANGGRRGTPGQRDLSFVRRDGGVVWALVSGSPVLDESGHVSGMLAMFTNVTERKLSEQRAKAAAEQIERLTGDAIYSVDVNGLLWSWNHGAEQLFGWTKDEAIGRLLGLVPPELREKATADVLRIIASGDTLTKETVRLAKDGRRIPVLGSWSQVQLSDDDTGVLCILKDLRTQRAAQYQLQEQAKALALLRERERIAMDLHDGAIQSLYGVALSLGALRRHKGANGSHDTVLGEAITQLTDTIQDMRAYIYELRTGMPEETDLEVALRAKAADVAGRTGVSPILRLETNLGRLRPDTVQHLLYIVNEALSNVTRHAQAANISIEARSWRSGIRLRVTDDGRGFDRTPEATYAGEGLRNMRERASLLGAKLAIESSPGQGTTVEVLVP